MNLMQRKLDLIQFIAKTNDASFLEEVARHKGKTSSERTESSSNNKNAKKCLENGIEVEFSEAVLEVFTNFYDQVSQQLEENQMILDRLEKQEMTSEMLLLQLRFQIKALQGVCYQFLLDFERQLSK